MLKCDAKSECEGAAGSRFDLTNCRERDYRLPIRIKGFEVTLRDQELYSMARGFSSPVRPNLTIYMIHYCATSHSRVGL